MIEGKKRCADRGCHPERKESSHFSVHQSPEDQFFHKGDKKTDSDDLEQQVTLKERFLGGIGKMLRQVNRIQNQRKQGVPGHSHKRQKPEGTAGIFFFWLRLFFIKHP